VNLLKRDFFQSHTIAKNIYQNPEIAIKGADKPDGNRLFWNFKAEKPLDGCRWPKASC
jgi:hypothetical protein